MKDNYEILQIIVSMSYGNLYEDRTMTYLHHGATLMRFLQEKSKYLFSFTAFCFILYFMLLCMAGNPGGFPSGSYQGLRIPLDESLYGPTCSSLAWLEHFDSGRGPTTSSNSWWPCLSCRGLTYMMFSGWWRIEPHQVFSRWHLTSNINGWKTRYFPAFLEHLPVCG